MRHAAFRGMLLDIRGVTVARVKAAKPPSARKTTCNRTRSYGDSSRMPRYLAGSRKILRDPAVCCGVRKVDLCGPFRGIAHGPTVYSKTPDVLTRVISGMFGSKLTCSFCFVQETFSELSFLSKRLRPIYFQAPVDVSTRCFHIVLGDVAVRSCAWCAPGKTRGHLQSGFTIRRPGTTSIPGGFYCALSWDFPK